MAIIDSIKNKLGDIIYPKTLTKAVYEVGTNKRLDVILDTKVPTERTINTKPLTSNIALNATDVGANTTSVNATLSATWSGSGPYTQSVAVPDMTASKNAIVSLASTATEAQREAARNASFMVTAQTTNQITITADGDKPTITIPISVILMP